MLDSGINPAHEEFSGRIVAARSGRLMATCFHPEITDDYRLHAAFIELVQDAVTEEAVA